MGTGQFVITAILSFVSITSVLIVLHELGHYLTARAFGLKAKAFSVGMGPELAGHTDKHGTRWKIAPIPLGGYVKFHGEMHPGIGTEEEGDHPQSFARLARWKRALIIFAGPFVNIAVCAFLLGALFSIYGVPTTSDIVRSVIPASPAATAGIKPGDRVLGWNGGSRTDVGHGFVRYVKTNPNKPITIELDRDGLIIEKSLLIERTEMKDRFGNKADIGRLGLGFDMKRIHPTGPLSLVAIAWSETGSMLTLQGETLMQMIKGERSTRELSGPMRLAKFSGEQFMIGWTAIVYFTAILSVAIAFMNLLPIPGLDGGYLALYTLEGVIRRDLSRRVFEGSVKFGYVCVAALMVFGISNDVRVLFNL